MKPVFEKRGLTKKSVNLSDWYHDVILRAGLADYSAVKGSMIIRPYGYALWEKIQSILDGWFKADGTRNAYFPLFIPYSLLKKEKEHVKGFSPELAVVEFAGGEKLAEPYVIRPTSETIMYKTFADWIQSYRDLPLKINQWCNVVRWEKRTYPFLRTTEFLWQEGHTVHAAEAEAVAMAEKALEWYRKFYEEELAVAVYAGLKSEGERFAGAKTTYSIEIVLPDGKALQAATAHDLSDHFAKVFDIGFLDEKGQRQRPYQTSWGLTTRSIGALVMAHGDDSGLIVPPRVADPQVVIIAIGGETKLKKEGEKIETELKTAGYRAVLDGDDQHSLGFRINEWEIKGVPLRLELGAKEIEKQELTFVRRDNFEKGTVKFGDWKKIGKILTDIQDNLFIRSRELRDGLTKETDNWEDFQKIMATEKSFIRARWCEDGKCEARVKELTKATPRVVEMKERDKEERGRCVHCGEPAHRVWLFAQSY